MRYGVHAGLQKTSVAELRKIWTAVELCNLDFASVWDHIYAIDFSGPDNLEAVTTHTAMALSTDRIRVGALVYSVGFRGPMLLANAIANIDQMSGGRAEIGIGAGWYEPEYRAYGIPFPSAAVRLRQLEELAICLRLLLHTDAPATYSGKYFTLDQAQCVPRPVQSRLPITIGGAGEQITLRIVAEHADFWNVPYVDPETFAAKRRVLDQHCETVGRNPGSITSSINLSYAVDDAALLAQFGPLADAVRPSVLTGSDDQIQDMIGQYEQAGAGQINLALRAPFDIDAIHRFAQLVGRK